MYRKIVTIYERNGWRVISYGNGAAYALHHFDFSAFFQGDDADTFRSNTMGKDGFFVDNCEERFGDYSDVMDFTDPPGPRCPWPMQMGPEGPIVDLN